MKLNSFMQQLSAAKRWIATTLFCVFAVTLIWQGAFFSDTAAMASPTANLIAASDAGDRVQQKTSEDAGRAKNFIQDAKDQVKRTANNNADRVEQATDSDDNFIERKAKRDRDRIEKRADEDAARTQKAVDNTKNAVERTVDNIKDAFSN